MSTQFANSLQNTTFIQREKDEVFYLGTLKYQINDYTISYLLLFVDLKWPQIASNDLKNEPFKAFFKMENYDLYLSVLVRIFGTLEYRLAKGP